MAMRKKTVFNIGMLTASNAIVRISGMLYKVWLAKNISPAALGIYQLSLSVYGFFMTPVASGLPGAVNRLCAKYSSDSKSVLACALRIALFPLIFSGLIMLLGKNVIAGIFLHEPSASGAVLALVPAVTLGAAATLPAGYLHSKEKSSLPAVFEMIEQCAKILSAVILIKLFADGTPRNDAVFPALAISFGGVISFVLSFAAAGKCGVPKKQYYGEIAKNAVPPTAAKGAAALLHLGTTSILPLCLISSGLSRDAALASYGVLTSMAYPVVFIPMTVISAVCVVYLPDIAKNLKDFVYIKHRFLRTLFIVFLISLCFSVLLLLFAPYAANKLFSRPEAGRYMVLLIPSVIFLGLKQICATTLNGIGRQKALTFASVLDGVLGLLLTFVLARKAGIYGFIGANCLQDIAAFAVHFILCAKYIKKGESK